VRVAPSLQGWGHPHICRAKPTKSSPSEVPPTRTSASTQLRRRYPAADGRPLVVGVLAVAALAVVAALPNRGGLAQVSHR
jgi:hypothetical protein